MRGLTYLENYLQGPHNYIERANRWFDGLINRDVDINKEIYSVHDVDFDRQVN